MIVQFPNRTERERDEILLAVMATLEDMGIRVVGAENLLDQFLAPITDGERRAFEMIAGVS